LKNTVKVRYNRAVRDRELQPESRFPERFP
jgi:hypothetical protein